SSFTLKDLKAGETYRIQASATSGTLTTNDAVTVELKGTDGYKLTKRLHAGDPDMYLPYRPARDGDARLAVESSAGTVNWPIRIEWDRIPLESNDRAALEGEPNDDWKHANKLVLGRDIYGTADDVDYLDNSDEGKAGLDWFRLDVEEDGPIL